MHALVSMNKVSKSIGGGIYIAFEKTCKKILRFTWNSVCMQYSQCSKRFSRSDLVVACKGTKRYMGLRVG